MRSSFGWAALVLAAATVLGQPQQVNASFHLWKIDQVFSNSAGNQQFIEMSTDADGQQFFKTDAGGPFGPAMLITNSQSFSFPHDLADPATAGHDTAGQHLLIATTGFSPKGLVPDFEIPSGFFSTGADTLKFTANDPTAVLDTVTWLSLPTDGTNSLHQVPGTTTVSTSEATASSFTGTPSDGGGGPSAIPLPPAFYPGMIGLALAGMVIGRGRIVRSTV